MQSTSIDIFQAQDGAHAQDCHQGRFQTTQALHHMMCSSEASGKNHA